MPGDHWSAWPSSNTPVHLITATHTTTQRAICPDLLHLCDLGEADNMRGRVVRAFFWVLDRIP